MAEKSWAQGVSSPKLVAFIYIPDCFYENRIYYPGDTNSGASKWKFNHSCRHLQRTSMFGLRAWTLECKILHLQNMAQVVFNFIRFITCPSSSSWSYNPGFTVLASTWGTAREMMFYLMVGIANLRQHFQFSVTTLKCYQCLPLRVKLGFVHNI